MGKSRESRRHLTGPMAELGRLMGQPRVLWTGTEIEVTEMAFEARKLLGLARPGVGWLS